MWDSVGNYHTVMLVMMMMMLLVNGVENGIREVGIGVILDMDSTVGKSTHICISMALEEFYGVKDNNFTTIIHPHFRDAKYDNFQAASAAIDLLENTQVMALLGPQQSSQADFVLDIANTFKVPIMSPATSPDLSSKQNPYFIRIAQTSSTQAQPIAALVKSFGWKEVVFIYEDSNFGRGPIPFLFDAMENIGTQVKYRTLLSPSSSDDIILQQLHKLKTMQTRVFVVHMLPTLALRFFKKANQVGMMTQGYVWIITDVPTALLHHLDPQDLDFMQGVVGVKPYIPPSNQLTNFQMKWRTRFNKEYPNVQRIELDMFAVWSYDSIFALATALQRVETKYMSTTFKRPKELSKDLEAIGTAEMGFKIRSMLRNIRLKGVSGDFHVINGQLQMSNYQLVNVIGNGVKQIGFWNSRNGLSKRITNNHKFDYTTNKDDLGSVIWPGDTLEIPIGLEILNLRVGLPVKRGFVEFLEAYKDPITDLVYVNGYCIDVFYAVIEALSYVVNYTLILYENPDGKASGNYNDLVYQVYLGKYDMAVGDIAILWNRTNYVDFTLPYAESGIAMLVPVKADDTKNAWIFMKPLETRLWVTIGAFFIYTGLVVWVLEHRVNKDFRGSLHQQVGIIFWFSFSTLVFAHRERMINNLSRFVVIVWVFVVLVLTSSYTASLSSMLTVQKLQPTVTNIYDLLARGDYIGYPQGSFVKNMLINMGFPNERLKMYVNFDEYAKALSDGSKNNGVSAIVDGVPYLKMLQAKNCNRYLMVGPIYKTAGMGFAFPKGSPLVAEFSRAILKVVEGQMKNISNKWFGKEDDCPDQDGQVQPFDKLTLASFKGLFLIAGLSSTYAVVVYLIMLVYENKEILLSEDSPYKKWTTIITSFYGEENKTSLETEAERVDDNHVHVEENVLQAPLIGPTIRVEPDQDEGVSSPCGSVSPTISIEHHGEGVSSPPETVSRS